MVVQGFWCRTIRLSKEVEGVVLALLREYPAFEEQWYEGLEFHLSRNPQAGMRLMQFPTMALFNLSLFRCGAVGHVWGFYVFDADYVDIITVQSGL